jgi:hypothetical protein
MRNYCTFGQIQNPFTCQSGHPSTVTAADIKYLHSLLDTNPVLYLDELQTCLATVHNLHISIATISQLLAQYNMTQKRVQKVAAEHDEKLWGIWEADMAQYNDPDVFVALDESAVNNQTIQCQYGQSAAGTPCVRRAAFLRGTHYSILPALTTEGIIALDIFKGSVMKDRFLTFIHEQVVRLVLISFVHFSRPHSSIHIQ